MYNALVSSCLGRSKRGVPSPPSEVAQCIFEVTSQPPNLVMVTMDMQSEETLIGAYNNYFMKGLHGMILCDFFLFQWNFLFLTRTPKRWRLESRPNQTPLLCSKSVSPTLLKGNTALSGFIVYDYGS